MKRSVIAVRLLAIGFVAMAIVSSLLVFNTVKALVSNWTGIGLPALFSPAAQEPGAEGELAGETPSLELGTQADASAWDGTTRVNILLMGLDFRDWQREDGPPRTDSMMLVTLDPVAGTGGMLSIPRDLWVEIPGFEHNRINTAYFLGETNRLPGGGPALAIQTVENLLGVPIQYYGVIEFSAFERAIDEIGYVEIWVDEDIKISPIGRLSYWLRGGRGHQLDGASTLAFARARKTEGGDFDRAERQQRVALAIRDQVTELKAIPGLIASAPQLYREISSGIQTNLSFEQLIGLALLAFQLEPGAISRGVIGPPEMVLLDTHPDGAQVLKPVPDKIRVLRDEIFTGTGAIAPSLDTETPLPAAAEENARLSVLNGAGVEGLASETSEYLSAEGLNVLVVANADRLDYDKSRLIVHSQNYPYTLRYLSELLGLSQGQILTPVIADDSVDIEIILGVDWAFSLRP